ncbi:MAG: sigma-54 dependent transcriptional regulator [Bacteroidales bacterium]|nr:sigma-54 dependent transcriptional regulator [Bacteroidales bacterium]
MKSINESGHILIIDDDRDVLNSLHMFLKHEFNRVDLLSDPGKIPDYLSEIQPDVILLDMNFSPGSRSGKEGISWLKRILKIDPDAIVILLTAYGDIQLAIKTVKEGATDFITKPWDNDKLITTLKAGVRLSLSNQELSSLKQKQKQLLNDIDKENALVWGESEVMLDLYKTIQKVSKTNTNILLIGENGTGKDLIAREIHRLSLRYNEAFVKVDMGSLSETVFESEMFGHIKGAFTDAKEDRIGRFEIANNGSIFLDEIGNLSLYLQAKLLTAIQNMEITRIGSNKQVQLDLRIISATNRDIRKMVEEDLFRQDLLYRLETIRIDIPPLRERGDDVVQFAYHFLRKFGDKYNKSNISINSEALDKLKNYNWPGNVRELQHTIEKAVILNETDTLKAGDFNFSNPEITQSNLNDNLNLSDLEKNAVERALIKNKLNVSNAAKDLGITRPTLYKKIEKYNIKL